MIQYKQPKKVKGARKKAREEVTERLMLKYPTWFEGKSDKEIKNLITAFRLSGKSEDEFPNYCIEYEAEMEKLSNFLEASLRVREFDPFIQGQPLILTEIPEFIKNMEDNKNG